MERRPESRSAAIPVIVRNVRVGKALFLRLMVVAISSCALLFAGTAAAAAAHTVVRPERFHFEAQLPSSDGYSLYLRGYGHRKIELDIADSENPKRPYTTNMVYRTTGRVNRHGIEADFGPFGQVELRFVGSSQMPLYRFPNCKAARPEVQYGAMKGRIEFESLGGVVKLVTNRVEEAETWRVPKRTCSPKPRHVLAEAPGSFFSGKHKPRKAESESFVQTFLARAHMLERTIDFFAIRIDGEVVEMAATSTRRFGPVLVSTSVQAPENEVPGPGEEVEFSIVGRGPRPAGATLSAASPFSGSGTYRRGPGTAPTWLGSLAAEIPGEGTLSLAGPAFHANLCGYTSNKLERACERTVAPPHLVG